MDAQDRDVEYYGELIGRRRVRAVLEAIEDVRRRREEGQDLPLHPSSKVGQGPQV